MQPQLGLLLEHRESRARPPVQQCARRREPDEPASDDREVEPHAAVSTRTQSRSPSWFRPGVVRSRLLRAAKGEFSGRYYAPVEGVGLYWHLVDLIWIYLFPLLYLIG